MSGRRTRIFFAAALVSGRATQPPKPAQPAARAASRGPAGAWSFERALILERQREGIAAAKQRGVYTGRKPALTAAQAQQLRERAAAGERRSDLAKEFRISRETVYSYLAPAGAAQSGPAA